MCYGGELYMARLITLLNLLRSGGLVQRPGGQQAITVTTSMPPNSTASAIEIQPDATCLAAICKQESQCTDLACAVDKDGTNQTVCGYYQLKDAYFTDCKSGATPLPITDWEKCAMDKACAEQCVKNYINMYATKNPDCQALLSQPNGMCKAAAATHNGGPPGCSPSDSKAQSYANIILGLLGSVGR
ncbi:destabilase domain-containing protein [Ditylenchus destructor]|nr:destabilase domain-containing protein [Ditylenchus destructor]